jgi:phosphatidylinositol alpha-1,6-mannosyltransferase
LFGHFFTVFFGETMIFLTHEFFPFRGGAATYVQETAAAAARLGLPVEVWTVDYGRSADELAEMDRGWNFPVVRLRANGRLTPSGIFGLVRGLWRERERLRRSSVMLLSVGAHMAWALLSALNVLPAKRAVIFFHGSELLRFQPLLPWGWLARRLYRSAQGFAVASRYVQELALKSGLLPLGTSLVLAPCACPTALQTETKTEIPPLGHKTHKAPADGGKLRILTAARLHPRKGQLELARALTRLPADLRARVVYQLVGVGEETYRRQVEQTCQSGGIACEFLGALSDEELAHAYARCDIYAQTSRSLARSVEGFGISYLEASFHGRPIVAFATGGVAEAVRDQETGLLIPEGDRSALTATIARLMTDEALRQQLGENGRKFARSFSWEASAKTLFAFDTNQH